MTRRRDPFSMARFEGAAIGMLRADPLGLLDIAEKHHGPGAALELFETDFFGVPVLDEDGVAVWRENFENEDDLPDVEPDFDLADVDESPSAHIFANPALHPRTARATARAATRPETREVSMNAAPQQAPPSRMTLANVQKGKIQRPHRVVLYGPEGIGKSSFGAGAPKPIFIPVEDGTGHLDVERFPKPDTWNDLRAAVRELATAKHDYQTLVIDTLDAAEALLWKHMIARDVYVPGLKQQVKLRDIEDYGYGKGFQKALEDWRALLKDIELLQLQRGMHFVGIAHSQVKNFKNPSGGDFDRYELKVNGKAAGLLKEWSDTVLFANYETFAKKDESNPKRVRGLDTGARLLFTERRAAYDAKHRGNLPESLPLSWADFSNEAAKEIDPKAFGEAIRRRAAELGEEKSKLVADTITKAAGNVQSLININNRVNALLAEQAAQKEEN